MALAITLKQLNIFLRLSNESQKFVAIKSAIKFQKEIP